MSATTTQIESVRNSEGAEAIRRWRENLEREPEGGRRGGFGAKLTGALIAVFAAVKALAPTIAWITLKHPPAWEIAACAAVLLAALAIGLLWPLRRRARSS
jgi:hypothetical protein